ncbi:hypothetical protein D3C76_806060 [compost metagenome]
MKATLRPKERLEVFQRGIGRFHHEGVAPRQALLEEAVHFNVPASLQFTQRFHVQHPRGLIRDFSYLEVEGFRQPRRNTLQGTDRVVPRHREALMHRLQGCLTSVGAVLHRLGIVVDGGNGGERFIVVTRFIAC